MRMLLLAVAGMGALFGFAPVDAAFDSFPLIAKSATETLRFRIADGMAAASPMAAETERVSDTRY